MDIDNAPKADESDDDDDSNICKDCEDGQYVLFEGDKVCRDCGYVAGSGSRERGSGGWRSWQQHRRESDDYSGWYGPNRIKMVGGFVSAYDFGDDFGVVEEKSILG